MGDYFALDIGTRSLRLVQLSRGANDHWSLDKVGYLPVDQKIIASDSAEGRKKLGQAIVNAMGQAGITAKNVVVGLPSNKTFTTVIEVPKMSASELKSTLKYQADQYIPMSLDDAKLDWAVLGDSPLSPNKQEVLLASTAQTYVEGLVEMIDTLGLNVIAAEPDPIAIARALIPANTADTRMILDIGDTSTDIVVVMNGAPRLIRALPMGLRTLVNAIVQNLNIKEDQAYQFIIKFGLAQDRLEGQVYRAIEGILENFAGELTKSVKFFQNKYATAQITTVHLSGYAGVIPQFPQYVTSKTGLRVEVTSPWSKVNISDAARQKIASVEFEYATAVGLAQRVEK
jgi:type IV pilus assembly protein PilM